jgi:fucose 4-O-acetylase-like acetyltransferase
MSAISNDPVNTSKRIGWVDAAKGIGILLVVLGHNQINSYVHNIHDLIYSFHMPLFFILAGMFLKPEQSFGTLAKRRFFSTLRPYLLILAVIYGVTIFFSATALGVVLPRLLKILFYALPNYYDTWMPLWFLPHLFVLSLFSWAVVRLVYRHLGPLWLRAIFLTGMLLCGVLALNVFSKIDVKLFGGFVIKGSLPWSADLLLITCAFFLIGYELRRSLPDVVLTSKWTVFISASIWLGLRFAFPAASLDLALRRYDFFAIVTLETLAACLLIFSLCRHLEGWGGNFFQALSKLGQYSIIILIFHGPIQFATFYKVYDLFPNEWLASGVAFLAGVGLPVLFCELVLPGNPRLAGWFGLSFGQEAVATDEHG